ncbi:MAG: gluconeogenesis factor YvcK family protein [bacterium]
MNYISKSTSMPKNTAKKIVTIGGGTGSYMLLSGLKKLPNVELSAIVPSTDSGGSSGRLRDEFGFLPPGDIRQCLVALAEDDEEQYLLRNIFSYRFDKGEDGLKGHTFGNLFLTVLTEVIGDELKAIEKAEKLLNIKGHVYPVTLDKTVLCAKYSNGSIIESEHNIDEPSYPHDGRLRIQELYLKPKANTYQKVKNAIIDSDAIVIGPGDLYTSILANLVVKGVKDTILKTNAKIFYVLNLVTKFGQTWGYSANDHINEIAKYMGRYPDYVIINDNSLPKEILKKYLEQNDNVVIDDTNQYPKLLKKVKIIKNDFLARETIKTQKGDKLVRSLIRHNSDKLAKTIYEQLNSKN